MTFQGCFLPSFDSFGKAVSEKIFLEINQSETRIAFGGYVCQRIGTKLPIFIKRSFIKIAHLVPIRQQTWPPQAILISDWSISKYLLLCNCLAK
jgi:hypothetical protein